jgi:glycosyltransferase involved in cell wall biosynthesis
VVVGVLAESMVTFRGDMLLTMVEHGHEVVAVAPEDDAGVRATLAAMGVHYRSVPIDRTSTSPVRDGRATLALARLMRGLRPDIVLTYAAKPVIYGSIAARLARVPHRAAMITGLGSALGGSTMSASRSRRTLAQVMRGLYRTALRGVETLFFQNPDDLAAFEAMGLIAPGTRIVRIHGSGVNLERFPEAALPEGPVSFLMVSRLIRDKGIREYVEAARWVREVAPEVRVRLLGSLDTNPTAVSQGELDGWVRDGVVEYLGSTDDVRPYLVDAHVVVLPSYGEGMPRSILEALAIGRPVVVTDVPGCRETVVDGWNGRLVPVRDAGALAEAMLDLVARADELAAMAERSHQLAVERYDVASVNATILEALGLS